MVNTVELDLPLGDAEDGALGARRHRHLMALPGLDAITAARLSQAFSSLAAVYAASEKELRRVVGPVAAARIRWFLEAPLPARGAASRPQWRHAA